MPTSVQPRSSMLSSVTRVASCPSSRSWPMKYSAVPVTVTTNAEFKKKTKFEGTLIGRDAEFVTINLKGRLQKIPIELVEAVRLPTAQTEAGDPYN